MVRAYVHGASGKGLLAGVLLVGFAISLPFWMMSTPEEKQQLTHRTTAMQVVESNVGPLDMKPEEQEHLRRMLREAPEEKELNFEEMVWLKDMSQLIRPWVADDAEAETIARWVYVYSVRFELSPELILGVIAVESQFDHFAISNVGARGLMQVMPFWKKKLGSPDDNLFEIETNLRYGCAIIRHYLDRYGKLSRALAAYNGSLGRHKYPNKVFAQMKKFKASRIDI